MTDRTKLWIAEKMKEIMKQKEIEKIRITEICAAADIERSTFYYHFKDKYDLIAWIFYHDAFNTNVIDEKEAAESMKKMKREVLFYRRAYADKSQNALWKYMHQYFTDEYTRIAEEKLYPLPLTREQIFSIRLYCFGAVGMAEEWILHDDHTPAEKIIRMMFNSMPEFMRAIYFGDRSK